MSTTVINPNNSGTIKLGTASADTEVQCQVTNYALTPSANTSEVAGTYCSPPTQTVGKSTWSLDFDFMQDWGASPSLSELLMNNDGEDLQFEFTPTDTSLPKASGTCKAVAGAFGGPAGEAWTASASLPVIGTPTMTPQP